MNFTMGWHCNLGSQGTSIVRMILITIIVIVCLCSGRQIDVVLGSLI